MSPGPLLSVKNLRTYFFLRRGVVRAVDDVTFEVGRGEVVGIAGESGSGKSVTAESILRIVSPPGRIVSGEIWLDGEDLAAASEATLQRVRGRKVAMIFQNPRTCLNPVMTVGEQITRVALRHRGGTRAEAEARALEMLCLAHIADPRRVFGGYPHQLSGGMCQRVMIVMALVCEPMLIIADEPTTGLDVTVQRQVLMVMRQLCERTGVAQVMISHDLGVIANTCQRIVVMYAGKIMEIGPVVDLYRKPLHPYSHRLIHATPRIDEDRKPTAIGGELPDPAAPPSGCRFHPRCADATERCQTVEPVTRRVSEGRLVACHLFEETST